MACIPLAFPPSFVEPKREPEATPGPSQAPAWNRLPNLGPYPTSHPSRNGVQKKRQKQSLPYRPKGSLAHLSPDEQTVELRQSRKAIRSKLYSRIARLQICQYLSSPESASTMHYADPGEDDTQSFPRALRFWPNNPTAVLRDLFVHSARELDHYFPPNAGRPARMIRFDAPTDEILIYTSASCLNQHTSTDTRSAASSCVFKPTGLHPSEYRSMAIRLERRGPTGQDYPQESNRAHLRAAVAALQCRQWRSEGWTAITIASDSEYLVEGITNWIEIWQQNGWLTSRDTGDSYSGNAVANRDLWELLREVLELSRLGLEVRFWLILHELNAEAHAEARMAAEVLKEEGFFCRMPYAGGPRL